MYVLFYFIVFYFILFHRLWELVLPHHGNGGRGAVKVPVEGKSCQLALQLDAEAAAVLLVHQGDLGPAAGCHALTARETGPDHIAQVGEESPDRRPQTFVQLLEGKRKEFSRLSGEKASWWQCSLAGTYLCPHLDGCCVHALLPHAL